MHQFVSVDGFAADANNEFTIYPQDLHSSGEIDLDTLDRLKSVAVILLGATTYRLFASFWPTPASAAELLADRINQLPKVVVSRHLTTAPWGPYAPASIISDRAVEAVARLKADVEGDIIVWGSLSLTEDLLEADLVDSVRLVVVPSLLGAGRGVFPPTYAGTRLRLKRSGIYDGDLVALEYDIRR